ncbi:MAG: dihydroorotate dehydrogenase electron transfer subunit [Deltaproteobacteria bacterium]|nr:dihydroorotate dehydrogenase electron transfer subunit [Deltaproteobacteria bacterium]
MATMAMGNLGYHEGEIKERKRLGSLYHRLRISLPCPIGPIIPGQFAMLKIEDRGGIILPRPFSIHNFEGQEMVPWLDFLFKVVGKGTGLLAKLSVGSPIMVLAPLGNGFPDPPPGYKALLIAGGMGIAPLFPLILRLKASPSPLYLFYGAQSQDDLICLPELINLEGIRINIATEDGTAGKKGMVTELLREEDDEGGDQTVIYACGPGPMLKAVADFAAERRRSCWISLEKRMACGVGACLGCVVETKGGYKRVCKDGPIFEAQEIIWRDDA